VNEDNDELTRPIDSESWVEVLGTRKCDKINYSNAPIVREPL